MNTGKIHIYYGDGKGKTSILNGMVIRALGYHWNVKYVRFLKNRPTGEILFFNEIKHPNLEIFNFYSSNTKFFWEMTEAEKAILKQEVQQGFAILQKLTQQDNVHLIVIDELLSCIDNNLITENEIIKLMHDKKPQIEMAFSGHFVSQQLINAADLVSNIKLIKHYYYENVIARKGIEF